MADSAAKREARRQRILQNSESRLQRITQTSLSRSKEIARKDETFNSQELEFSKSNIQYQYTTENHNFPFNFSDEQYCANESEQKCENLNLNSTHNSSSHISYKLHQHSSLSNLFCGSFSCIILAIFINILFIAKIELSVYKSIITPYILLEITRLCLRNKTEESQGSQMFVAILILCKIQPKIVHNLKNSLDLCTTIFKDFALYLTSFVLFNRMVSIFGISSNNLQFI